ncbi:MAG: extracellular solute-binding protein [Actinomycetaceae bacterium]|nr:extracellular solute-binding protein [Actinomycetaceae bacterium]
MGKSRVLLASTAALSLLLAGCMGGTTNSNDADTPVDDGAIPRPNVNCEIPDRNVDGDVIDTSEVEGEITFMTQGLKGTFSEFFEAKIKEFEEAHPGTTINWTDQGGSEDFDTIMVTQAGNCSMADVINVPSATILALSRANLLLDFDTKAPGIGEHFVPGVWETVAFGANDAHTALPWYYGPFITTYNKSVFERAGLDPEKPPATMDEYFEFAHKIADSGSGDYAVYGNTTWYLLAQWRAFGVNVMNDDYTEFTFAADPQAKKWVEEMAALYEKGAIPKDSITGDLDMSKAYGAGNLAFGSPNPSFLRNVAKNAGDVYEETGVGPEALNAGIAPLFNGQFIAVSVTTPNAPLAIEFARFITSDEQGAAWANYGIDTETAVAIPLGAKALQDPKLASVEGDDAFADARRLALEQAAKSEAFGPMFYVTGQVSGVLLDNVNQAIVGDLDPQDALDAAQTEMNSMLDTLNKK